jgi:hypothetical protein
MLKEVIEESKLIKLIEESMFELEKGRYVEVRNEMLDHFLKRILTNIELVEEFIEEFMLTKKNFSIFKNLLYNNAFCSLQQLKVELISRFNCEEIKITTEDNNILDGILIKANNSINTTYHSNDKEFSIASDKFERNNKTVMIICGPNAAPYEIFAYSNRWMDYYVDAGINLFLWNYRGYGDSKGTIDFSNMKKDAECVADFMKQYYKFSKIGVHGISLGGVPACHIAGYLFFNLERI